MTAITGSRPSAPTPSPCCNIPAAPRARPRAPCSRHANVSINVQQVTAWRGQTMRQGDRVLGVLPLFHVFAMTAVMNFGIGQGTEIIIMPRFVLIDDA